MSEHLPSGPRIDRAALERIIHRAAELQAGEREIGEGLTEQELLQLGQDVGIPEPLLQQALLEERTRSAVVSERGPIAWLAGPRSIAADRTIPIEARRLEAALSHWMTDGELLTVKRRYPNQTSWEAQQGVFATLRRGLGLSGRRYQLARAREVAARVHDVGNGVTHVALIADLGNSRSEYLGGAFALVAVGAVASAIGLALGVASAVAAIPAAAGLVAGWFAARARLKHVERFQVALEQVLDRLEHGEVQPQRQVAAPRPSAFARIANEIRKNL